MKAIFTIRMQQLFLICLALISTNLATGQDVVIQEVLYNPAAGVSEKIALKNVSSSTLDISNWCICNVPQYRTINNATTFNILSGDPTDMKPNDVVILELTGSGMVFSNTAELALYHTNGCGGYTTASNMEDFVRWGNATGSTRASVAESAGLWTNGNFVATAAQGEILQFDGTSDGVGNESLPSDYANVANGLLPVEFIDFTARKIDGAIQLNWSTASETNSDYFAIGRSTNGMQYEEIARVEAAGFSSETRNYEYIDQDILTNQVVYYRLEQVDQDGKMSYSSIEVIGRDKNAFYESKISPNPIKNDECLFIELGSDMKYEQLDLIIHDYTGKVLIRKSYTELNDSAYQMALDFPYLRTGFYFLSLYSDGELLETKPLIVVD